MRPVRGEVRREADSVTHQRPNLADWRKLDPELLPASADPVSAALDTEMKRQSKSYKVPSLPSRIVGNARVWRVGTCDYPRPVTDSYHLFLIDFLMEVVSREWFERRSDPDHPLIRWLDASLARVKKVRADDRFVRDGVRQALSIGAELSLKTLAHDLAHLRHQEALPKAVLKPLKRRLRNREEFQSARYELAVGGICARAGLRIRYLDDKTKRQPEFIATDPITGASLAVEAKSRHPSDELDALRGKVVGLISDAHGQNPGDRPFVIFVDANAPGLRGADVIDRAWFQNYWHNQRDRALPPSDKPDECNGLFLTSFPWHWEPDALVERHEVSMEFSTKPKHPLPDQVVGRITASLDHYDVIPVL
jgi:hypothetical protein